MYDRPDFAERYDRYRPAAPPALVELVHDLVGRPALVVDLGCGTGLSTRVWADNADRAVGVEPSAAMAAHARRMTRASNVEYVNGSAYDTGLPGGSVDVVTASQSLAWMEPERAFPEIDRILRPGGLLCAYEYNSLLTPLWAPEQTWTELRQRTHELRKEHGPPAIELWPVSRERLAESGVFRYTRELLLHNVEEGDGDRLVGFALSEGSLQTLLESGVSEDEAGLPTLRAAAAAMSEPVPWWIGYRVWLGLK